jgi:hypothetical protein
MARFARFALLSAATLAFAVTAAHADLIIYGTPSGSTAGGQPVSAQAQFTTSAGELSIELTNLQANPTSVVQNISDLFFTISTGQLSGTLSSSSGTERSVAKNGTVH